MAAEAEKAEGLTKILRKYVNSVSMPSEYKLVSYTVTEN